MTSGSILESGRSPGVGNGNPVFLPGESHGQRNLEGYNPWSCMELDYFSVEVVVTESGNFG